MMTGKVWLVGAGPSDSGLFTLKGKAVLEQADVVVYDQLVGQGILHMIPAAARRVDVGKHAGNHKMQQEDINQLLLEEAQAGNRVVRLKGGDPFLFGRGGEELELLHEHHIPFEIVPGITSALSVPAYAGIPVTHRDFTASLHIITGHRKRGIDTPPDYDKLVALGDVTLVFLMSIGALPDICQGLIDAGMDPDMPAAVLERGTTAAQRRAVGTVTTLPTLAAAAHIGTPGIIIVGRVCTLSEEFHWAEDRVLGGCRVIITRPAKKASRLSKDLAMLGAEVIELPSIETVIEPKSSDFMDSMQVLPSCQWMLFTSETGVDAWFHYLSVYGIDVRKFYQIKIAAVGKTTAKALRSHGLMVDYMPDTYSGEALGHGLLEKLHEGDRIMAYTPNDTVSDAVEILKDHGYDCSQTGLYHTEILKQEPFDLRDDDLVVFTSASTVHGFVKTMENQNFKLVTAVCIGEQTAKAAHEAGMKVVVSEKATLDSLVDTVVKKYNKSMLII